MRRKRFLIVLGASLLVALLGVLFAPFLVATGLRFWMTRAARQQGLRIETERIEAAFLRPAVIHQVRITNEANAPFRIVGTVSRLEIDLNLAGIFTGAPRALHSLTAEGIALDVRRNAPADASSARFAWPVPSPPA